jgi:hypothetical protein
MAQGSVVQSSVPSGTEAQTSISKLTSYLSNLSSAIYRTASGVTKSSVGYATEMKKAIDPVVNAIGQNARAVRDLTYLGALFDKSGRSTIRSVYEGAASVSNDVATYERVKSGEIDSRLNDSILSEDQVRDSILSRALPQVQPDPAPQPKPKGKKKRGGAYTGTYRGKIKVSRRRK